jgi:catechol 2,3-dioxygenase-like lactoylglutathione lyase family enzyme
VSQHLALIALLVRDYDEAIAYYRDVLGFELLEDTVMAPGKRWVVVSPPGARETRLLLARAANEAQAAAVGLQSGGRVFLFLHTDDFARDYARYRDKGVRFVEERPREETFGTVIVFEDLYGNRWDLVQPKRG